jgi:acyl-CoA thioesterase
MSDTLAFEAARALMAREGTAAHWNLTLEEAREGYARVSMELQDSMLNGHRTAHGGMIFALADSAFAYACNSRNVATVAQGATIHFLSPARAGETLIAEARELMLVGRTGSYVVDVRTADGRAVASFHGLSRSIGGPVIEQENQP